MHLYLMTGELIKLQEDGYLIYVDKEQMEKDKLFPKQKCFSAIVKKDMCDLDESFFSCAKDSECTDNMYETNYNKEIDKVLKQVTTKYTQNVSHVNFSLPSNISSSMYDNYITFKDIILIHEFNEVKKYAMCTYLQ